MVGSECGNRIQSTETVSLLPVNNWSGIIWSYSVSTSGFFIKWCKSFSSLRHRSCWYGSVNNLITHINLTQNLFLQKNVYLQWSLDRFIDAYFFSFPEVLKKTVKSCSLFSLGWPPSSSIIKCDEVTTGVWADISSLDWFANLWCYLWATIRVGMNLWQEPATEVSSP